MNISSSNPQVGLITMEEILKTLVAFRTISNDFATNHDALNYIEDYLSARHMHVERLPRTANSFEALVASPAGVDAKRPTVMLAAHLDVVAGPDHLFGMRHQDGYYYGRGVHDMKSAIAAYMTVVDQLQGDLEKYDFSILITSDEEIGGREGINTVQQLAGEYLPKMLVLPDGGRDWQLEVSAKGFMRWDLEAHGKAAHGSRPWEGENAIVKLVALLDELKEHFADHGPETDTYNIGVISGGEVVNRIPHYAKAEIDMRLSSPESQALLTTKVEELCEKYDIHATLQGFSPPTFSDLDSPYIKTFATCIEEITGITVTGVQSHGGSDARYFAAYNVPCAVFYPAGGGHHSDAERIEASVIEHFPKIIRTYLERVARSQ